MLGAGGFTASPGPGVPAPTPALITTVYVSSQFMPDTARRFAYAKGIQLEVQRPPGYLTAKELTAAAGITYRQADFWTTAKYLIATEQNPGSGNIRFYSPAEVRWRR